MKKTLIAYGAVARKPHPRAYTEKLKRYFRLARQARAYKASGQADYRAITDLHTYNLGDHAIILGALETLTSTRKDLTYTPVDWGDIEIPSSKKQGYIICGSGYFFINQDRCLSQRLKEDFKVIAASKLPAIIYGAGVNFVDSKLSTCSPNIASSQSSFLREFLSLFSHISVRDASSKYLLEVHTEKPITITGDPALFLTANKSPTVTSIDRTILSIGINIPFHGPAANERINADLQQYITFLNQTQAETGCHFFFMVHFDSEELIAKIIQDAGIRLTIVNGDVEDLLRVYGQLDMHIGGMLHSCILASSVGTPSIGLAYDIKHAGFFDLIGFPDHCVPAQPFNSEKLIALTRHILLNRAQISEAVLRRKNELALESARFLSSALASF